METKLLSRLCCQHSCPLFCGNQLLRCQHAFVFVQCLRCEARQLMFTRSEFACQIRRNTLSTLRWLFSDPLGSDLQQRVTFSEVLGNAVPFHEPEPHGELGLRFPLIGGFAQPTYSLHIVFLLHPSERVRNRHRILCVCQSTFGSFAVP